MGFYYNAYPAKAARPLTLVQFWVSTVGVWAMIPGLCLMLLQISPGELLVVLGSLITLAGMLLFAVNVFRD